jgi:hypothetical protein
MNSHFRKVEQQSLYCSLNDKQIHEQNIEGRMGRASYALPSLGKVMPYKGFKFKSSREEMKQERGRRGRD